MTAKMVIEIVVTAVLAMTIMFLTIGNRIRQTRKRKLQRCTILVNATVTDIVRDRTTSDNGTSYYCPVFEYEVNGQQIRRKSPYGKSKPQFRIGEKVSLHVNPEDATDFYHDKNGSQTISTIFTATGILLICAGIFIVWIGRKFI